MLMKNTIYAWAIQTHKAALMLEKVYVLPANAVVCVYVGQSTAAAAQLQLPNY